VLDDGEVFDSTLLKETITNYIAAGKNNVLIDLVQLDYIYSDSMNVIMSLNKSISETGGNFGLLQVRPEVIQILQKAGVANTLRIFNSEEEVQSFSASLMQSQQQGFAQPSSQSQSEFDQLRSEIGSVFGGAEQPSQDFGNQGYAQQAQPRQPASRPIQQPQNPYARPGFPTQQPQFQGRQFTPPPPPPLTPTRPIVPPPVQTGGIGGAQKPPVRPPFSTDQPRMGSQPQDFATETQRFPQVPQTPVQPKKAEPPLPASFNDELEEITSKAGRPRAEMPSARVDAIDNDDDILSDDIPKKKSPAGIIVALLILLALIGAGYYAITSGIIDIGQKPQTTVQKPATTPAPAVTPAPAATQPVATTEPPPPPSLEPVKPEPTNLEPVKPEPVKPAPVTTKKIVKKSVKQPAIAAEPEKKASVNKIQITSIPVGASISVNGEMIGKTPYTWDRPVYGPISIELSRAGYKSTSKDIEFTGGIVKESFTLERELPPPAPKPEPVPEPEPKRPEPVVTPEPTPTPSLASEPEPEPEPSKPVVSTPVVSTAGGDASIYFASLPPIAEVYLNGKLVGRTNVAELKLPSGTLVLRFVKGAKEVTQEITLQPGKNPSRLIRLP
jgi:anti-anti-sigma factor